MKLHYRLLGVGFILFIFSNCFLSAASTGWLKDEGVLPSGALFSVVGEEGAKGPLLIMAHGYRPEAASVVVDLDTSDPWLSSLLEGGWTIAATSYRRNGWVFMEGAEDLQELREKAIDLRGPFPKIYLLGTSMGGGIATMLGERNPGQWDGILAMGAALYPQVEGWEVPLNYQPGVPLLFLSNQSESDGPQKYRDKVAGGAPEAIVPAVWEVMRDGHVNLNAAEMASAMDALVDAVERNVTVAPRKFVETQNPPSQATEVNGGWEGLIRKVDPAYGNLHTTFVEEDLMSLIGGVGGKFTFRVGEAERLVTFGTSYGEVPQGEWIGFIDANGYLLMAINMGNAAADLGIKEGAVCRIASGD